MSHAHNGKVAENLPATLNRYSVFFTSDNYFGIEISAVREVIPIPKISKIPNVPRQVLGIFNLRSNLISLVDIRPLLGFKLKKKQNSDMVLILGDGKFTFGILVEKVMDFIMVEKSKIQIPSNNISKKITNYISGLFEMEGLGVIHLLDTNRLHNSNDLF